MSQYIAAIDQGTTSTRCIIFNHAGQVVACDQSDAQEQVLRAVRSLVSERP